MSEGDQNQGEKPLDDAEIRTELSLLVGRNILTQKIAQRIAEKLKERNIRITKNQLYRLTEKLQSTLSSYRPSGSNQLEQPVNAGTQTLNDTMVQTTDMKRLLDAVEQLNQRIKLIEENRIDGVQGVSGRLMKTKDIKTLESTNEMLEGHIQPLDQIPSDPESIVVIMKWLQYLVDRTGKNNLPNILGYYVDIGWISEDVRLDVINYSKGITEEPAQACTHPPQLPTKDHLQSLLFIQKLKGLQLDDRFLNKIEREMEKIVKSLEGYPLK
jgi:archaellum component FlaD/FlaE